MPIHKTYRLFKNFSLKLSCLLFAAAFILSSARLVHAASQPFPEFQSIKENVEFWKKVYAEYPSTKGFIHDSQDLSIIYEIIDIKSHDEPGALRANKQKVKKTKEKYKSILTKLAQSQKPQNSEEMRVAKLFGNKGNARVWREAADQIRFQKCLKDRFAEGIVRSGRYLGEIKSIFKKHGLPVDLAYLPHVESSFNYNAYSKFGAAGIWQFIRATGRRFLTISYTIDERRDPILSAEAAAKYLKENHEKLHSWPLALTAYNHGANSMIRAKAALGNYENIYNNYENRRFGFASKNFYAEFLAAREIAKNYQKYFKDLKMDEPINTKTIELQGYIPVDDLARHYNTDLETIKNFNRSLRNPIFNGQKYVPKGFKLKLPMDDKRVRFAEIPNHLLKNQQKRSRFYRVERGDTAGKIAMMHKVKLSDLKDINQLGKRATIYVGQNLRIPDLEEKTHIVKGEEIVALSENNKNKPQDSSGIKTAAVITEQVAMLSPEENNVLPNATSIRPPDHNDNRPEILAEKPAEPIKAEPSLSPAELKSTAAVQPEVIKPAATEIVAEQKIVKAEEGTEEEPAVELTEAKAESINQAVVLGNFMIDNVMHENGYAIGIAQVEYLETLGHYADWLEIPTQEIRELNKLSFRTGIRAHHPIKLPLRKVSKSLFEERRYEFHKEIEEDFFSAYRIVGIEDYSIKRGDNIWTLCRDELDLPFWLMMKYNPITDFESLRPNQKIIVPIVEKVS